MFGHNTTDQISQDQQSDAHVALPDDTINDLTGATPTPDQTDQPAGAPPVKQNDYVGGIGQTIQPPAAPEQPAETPEISTFPPASNELSEEPQAPAEITPLVAPTSAPVEAHDDLLAIKQDALNSLSPLVHNLELETEEKFKTLMMLIQASDDHNLVKEAYEAAQAIPDEKVRAQALLDVVNEINYFTHSKEDAKN